MRVEVIGAGFGRTGTTSLKAAMEGLGFGPCYHMRELLERPDHVGLWEAAARGEPTDWDAIFSGYRATVGWPGGAFYEELMEEYPEAKVILTVRDPEGWYESTRGTIYGTGLASSSPLFRLLAPLSSGIRRMKRIDRTLDALAWGGLFDGRFEDREYAIGTFERWNEGVRERVPPERLLIYEVGQGWGPLCEFLGVEAPEGEPFPRLNDAEALRGRIRLMRMRALLVAVPAVAALALAAATAGVVALRKASHHAR